MSGYQGNSQARQRQNTGRAGTFEMTVLILALAAVVGAAGSASEAAPPSVRTVAVRVSVGDTAWSLARAYPITGLSTAQTAEYIMQINDDGAGQGLAAGAKVLVPLEPAVASYAMR